MVRETDLVTFDRRLFGRRSERGDDEVRGDCHRLDAGRDDAAVVTRPGPSNCCGLGDPTIRRPWSKRQRLLKARKIG